MELFGLADCNNFYCSCERVFRPDLRDVPVVVLSNNDGCIIARSNEAKALGLKMGDPLFKVREVLERHGVAVFSSNYTLYGDMSRRVMSILSRHTPKLEVYSIDEAFMDLSGMGGSETLRPKMEEMVRSVGKGTGIPISLGIAPTRTLAKMASKFAKKYKGYHGVCIIDNDVNREKALRLTEVGDVWGIGPRMQEQLRYYGVGTAWDYVQRPVSWVRKLFHVTGERTWKELQGIPCIEVEDLPQKKSICTSRSFDGEGIAEHDRLEEAVANFASECCRKLREQKSRCRAVTVFAYTSRFHLDRISDMIYETRPFSVPTNDTAEIMSAVLTLLRSRYKSYPFLYKKAGVVLQELVDERYVQTDLFDTIDRSRQNALTKAVDAINRKKGHNMVRLGIQGHVRKFELKNEYLSRHYTTDLKDVIVLQVK